MRMSMGLLAPISRALAGTISETAKEKRLQREGASSDLAKATEAIEMLETRPRGPSRSVSTSWKLCAVPVTPPPRMSAGRVRQR
jgi:hypothetical protein